MNKCSARKDQTPTTPIKAFFKKSFGKFPTLLGTLECNTVNGNACNNKFNLTFYQPASQSKLPNIVSRVSFCA